MVLNSTGKMIPLMVCILTIGLLWAFPDRTSFSETNDACVRCHTDAMAIDTITTKMNNLKDPPSSG